MNETKEQVSPRGVLPDTETATQMLSDLINAEIRVVHAFSSGEGSGAELRQQEVAALKKVFLAMTGFEPNRYQIRRIIG